MILDTNKSISNALYLFKKITFKKGFRGSLHVHDKKIETAYIVRGRLKLLFGKEKNVIMEQNGKKIILWDKFNVAEYGPGQIFNIFPHQVHRVETLKDTLLLECQTNNPDDIRRFADDWGRGDKK